VLVALVYNSLYPSMGSLPGLKAFSVVILGGLGSIPGTILGGFVIGLSEVFGSVYLPHVVNKHAIAFVILIIVMIFRPQGLFGTRVEKV
jgi:branched-chain amino acid transport system permease protein